jgi:nitroreductase
MAAVNATVENPALDLLLKRRSHHRLTEPGPSDEELDLILRAALRVPDFGRLRPFRFLAARGTGRDRLGLALQRAAAAAGRPDPVIARAPTMPRRAPLIILTIFRPRPDAVVSLLDQQLCAGSTVLTMQLAARALGYSGVWRSGWPMHDRGVHRELGLDDQEQILGFLYLGTPMDDGESRAEADQPLDYLTWL